jgi:hypothetical protein
VRLCSDIHLPEPDPQKGSPTPARWIKTFLNEVGGGAGQHDDTLDGVSGGMKAVSFNGPSLDDDEFPLYR